MKLIDLLVGLNWLWVLALFLIQSSGVEFRPGTVLAAFWVALILTCGRVLMLRDRDL